MNNVKIANNITNCTFTQGESNGKVTIEVTIAGENKLTRTTIYTLID